MVLFKEQLFDLEVKGQGPTKVITVRDTALWSCTHIRNIIDLEVKGQDPTKVITVRDTPPYGHAPTYQISLAYLGRQKSYDPDKLRWKEAEVEEKIRLK